MKIGTNAVALSQELHAGTSTKPIVLDKSQCQALQRSLVALAKKSPEKAAIVIARLDDFVSTGRLDIRKIAPMAYMASDALFVEATKIVAKSLSKDILALLPDTRSLVK